MNALEFLGQNRVGLLLRVYANKQEQIPARVAEMREMVSRALSMFGRSGQCVFSRVDIVVWADQRYNDSDCGQTAPTMQEAFKDERAVSISEYRHGDLFCGILNWGVANQMSNGVNHTVIASTQALDHMNLSNVKALLQAVGDGALVAGIAIHELAELVMRGRIANTFAIWDNVALMCVGGFDLRAMKPVDDREAVYINHWSPENGSSMINIAGVEEMIPIARMVRDCGPCIAPILPADESARYRVPDPTQEPDNYARHLKKLGTKKPRQDAHLAYAGFATSYLEGGILPEYRQQI